MWMAFARKAVVLSAPPPAAAAGPHKAKPKALRPLRQGHGSPSPPDVCARGDRSPKGKDPAASPPKPAPKTPPQPPSLHRCVSAIASDGPPPPREPEKKRAVSASGGPTTRANGGLHSAAELLGTSGLAAAALGVGASGGAEDGAGFDEAAHIRAELIRLRKRMHHTNCELQRMREQYELAQRDLWGVRASNDELRLKYTSLEKLERVTSAELLDERRKCDELSKQVKAMSQNLMSIMGQQEGGSDNKKDITGLQKRCFKLVQQNTALTVQSSLLRRQKGWAEAKARVLQEEVTAVYLGIHDQVRSSAEIERDTSREFTQRQQLATNGLMPPDGAQVCKLLMPFAYKHREAVIDFCTHVTHTCGNDVHGFLNSSRVFSEGIRNECLSGLGREYYAHWRLMRQLPLVLRATERLVHLGEYLEAFEGFARETSDLLGCGLTKLWVVDHFRQVLWTCYRSGEEVKTLELVLPKSSADGDLAGQGLVVAAAVSQKVVSVPDASTDLRCNHSLDAVSGRTARSVLCVPVMHKGQTKVVFQAMNKLEEPDFDAENDAKLLRLLGRVSMEVLQVCQSNTTQSAFTKRKEALLQLFNDFVPCQTAVQLMHALEKGLRELFLTQVAALHLVTGRSRPLDQQCTVHIQVDTAGGAKKVAPSMMGRRRSTIVHRVETQGLRGIVGASVRSMQNLTFAYSQIANSPYDSEVDLDMTERTVLHTVPIMDASGPLAVCQFLCPDRVQSVVSDDGTFRPDNMQHMRLLQFLMKFVQKHIDIIDRDPMEALRAQMASGTGGLSFLLPQFQAGAGAVDGEESALGSCGTTSSDEDEDEVEDAKNKNSSPKDAKKPAAKDSDDDDSQT